MNKKIPINIMALSEISDYKKFLENDEHIWPYDDINFHSFIDKVLNLFNYEASSLENDLKESILNDVYFVIHLIEFSHNLIIQKNHLFQKNLFDKKNLEKYIKKFNLNLNQDKVILKKILKNLIFSKKNFSKRYKIFGSKNNFVENYIFSNQGNIEYDYTENYFHSKNLNKSQFNDKIKNFVDSFFLKYNMLVTEYFLIEIDFTTLKKIWCKRINQINNFKKYFKNFFCLDDKAIYFSNNENQYHRILSLALKKNKVETFSFDHGYDNYIKRKKTNYWFKNNYSFHVCYNQSSKKFLEKDISLYSPFPKNLLPKFITYQNNIYLNKKKKLFSKKNSKGIKNVMLIGFPMNSNRHFTEIGNFWYFKLFLEIKILKKLKKANFNVIYKIHPDVLGWEKIMLNYCDEIRYTKFEDKISDIDLTIFTYTANSCLMPAICSNIPIIIFDTNLDNYNKNQFQAFNKRCKILKIKFDKRGYLFDEKNFIETIDNMNTDIDNEYFERFLV